MSWYSRINSLQNLLQSHSNQRLNFPSQLRSRLREDFKQTWNEERMQNRKLAFYNSAKLTFEPERYIDSNIGYKDLKRLSQFRMSSHKYNIETGRYGKKQTNILNRICEYCTTEDNETIGLLYECPFLSQLLKTKTMSSTFVPDTQKPERSSTKEHANYFSRQMDWPKYFRMKFLLKTWRSSLVDATTSNFQKMREKNLPKPLKKIPHLIKVTIYQEVVTFSSHNKD